MTAHLEVPRYPGPKSNVKFFAATTGAFDGILVTVNDPDLMVVVEGIDVYATSSGVGTEFFSIDVLNVVPPVNARSIFSNQVNSQTGLNFQWRGNLSIYVSEQINLHSIAGSWGASAFGFLTAADNQPR